MHGQQNIKIYKTFDQANGILLHENASSSNVAQRVTFEKCQFESVMEPYRWKVLIIVSSALQACNLGFGVCVEDVLLLRGACSFGGTVLTAS